MKTNTLLWIIIVILVIVFSPVLISVGIMALPLILVGGACVLIALIKWRFDQKQAEKAAIAEKEKKEALEKKKAEELAKKEAEELAKKEEEELAQQEWDREFYQPLMDYIDSDETNLAAFLAIGYSSLLEHPALLYALDQQKLVDIFSHFIKLKAIVVEVEYIGDSIYKRILDKERPPQSDDHWTIVVLKKLLEMGVIESIPPHKDEWIRFSLSKYAKKVYAALENNYVATQCHKIELALSEYLSHNPEALSVYLTIGGGGGPVTRYRIPKRKSLEEICLSTGMEEDLVTKYINEMNMIKDQFDIMVYPVTKYYDGKYYGNYCVDKGHLERSAYWINRKNSSNP